MVKVTEAQALELQAKCKWYGPNFLVGPVLDSARKSALAIVDMLEQGDEPSREHAKKMRELIEEVEAMLALKDPDAVLARFGGVEEYDAETRRLTLALMREVKNVLPGDYDFVILTRKGDDTWVHGILSRTHEEEMRSLEPFRAPHVTVVRDHEVALSMCKRPSDPELQAVLAANALKELMQKVVKDALRERARPTGGIAGSRN